MLANSAPTQQLSQSVTHNLEASTQSLGAAEQDTPSAGSADRYWGGKGGSFPRHPASGVRVDRAGLKRSSRPQELASTLPNPKGAKVAWYHPEPRLLPQTPESPQIPQAYLGRMRQPSPAPFQARPRISALHLPRRSQLSSDPDRGLHGTDLAQVHRPAPGRERVRGESRSRDTSAGDRGRRAGLQGQGSD